MDSFISRETIIVKQQLIGLQPKLDEDRFMRSDGHLKHAEFLSFDVRYPVILPRRSWVTKLIIKEFHEKEKRATGTNHTLAALLIWYWYYFRMGGNTDLGKGMHGMSKKKSKSLLIDNGPSTTLEIEVISGSV